MDAVINSGTSGKVGSACGCQGCGCDIRVSFTVLAMSERSSGVFKP